MILQQTEQSRWGFQATIVARYRPPEDTINDLNCLTITARTDAYRCLHNLWISSELIYIHDTRAHLYEILVRLPGILLAGELSPAPSIMPISLY